jgi:spermidine synthase
MYHVTRTSWIAANLFVTGFVSSSIQLLLIREMMNMSGGYELASGIFLSTWLIISAVGAFFAGRSTLPDPGKINTVFALSPLLSLFLMFFLSRLFLGTGETPSVLVGIVYNLLVLIPFCISSGFVFVKLISIAQKTSGYNPGKSFSIETSGGIAAGILISLLVSEEIGTYKLMLVIILLSVTYTLLTFYLTQNTTRVVTKIIATVAVSVIVISDPDILFRQIFLPGIKVTESRDTPYGNITTGTYHGEKSLYYNQRLLKYSDDVVEREEDIHYAMLQHKLPEKVVIISGSFESHISELLKYPVKNIVYIERDPVLASMINADNFKEKVTISNTDAFSYIRKTSEKADVIIMLVPPPSTLLLNRYYTKEFFSEINEILNKGGIFLCSPGASENYYNDESLNLNSSIFNSMKAVFRNVIPIAGNKLYYIASDDTLTTKYCQLIASRGIANLYVSTDYLSDDLTERKTKEIYSLLNPSTRQNSFAFPLAYSYFQSFHISKNKNEKIIVIVLLIVLFALPLLTVNRRNLTMYFSASALAGFEIIALLTLQLTVGNMYQMTGLIIAGLMAGLAAGAGYNIRFLSRLSLALKGIILIFFYFITGLIYMEVIQIETRITAILIILNLSFLPAFITGSIFRDLTMKKNVSNDLSRIYSADLSGSAMGFIAVAGFAIPVFGIIVTLYFLGALVFTGILFGTILNKH